MKNVIFIPSNVGYAGLIRVMRRVLFLVGDRRYNDSGFLHTTVTRFFGYNTNNRLRTVVFDDKSKSLNALVGSRNEIKHYIDFDNVNVLSYDQFVKAKPWNSKENGKFVKGKTYVLYGQEVVYDGNNTFVSTKSSTKFVLDPKDLKKVKGVN